MYYDYACIKQDITVDSLKGKSTVLDPQCVPLTNYLVSLTFFLREGGDDTAVSRDTEFDEGQSIDGYGKHGLRNRVRYGPKTILRGDNAALLLSYSKIDSVERFEHEQGSIRGTLETISRRE